MNRIAIGVALVAIVTVLLFMLVPHGTETASRSAPRTVLTAAPATPEQVATRFLVELSLPVMLTAERRDAVIARYAAPKAGPALRSEYASEAARLRAAFSHRPRIARTALIGYRRLRLSAVSTAVDVWAVTVGGAGQSPVSVGWRLLRVTLERERGAWKVRAVRERPAPPMDGTAQALANAADHFEDYDVAP